MSDSAPDTNAMDIDASTQHLVRPSAGYPQQTQPVVVAGKTIEATTETTSITALPPDSNESTEEPIFVQISTETHNMTESITVTDGDSAMDVDIIPPVAVSEPSQSIPQAPSVADVFSALPPPSNGLNRLNPPASAHSTISNTDSSAVTTIAVAPQISSTTPRPASPERMVRTGYIYDPTMMLHCHEGYIPNDSDAADQSGHPEEPMRIKRIFDRLSSQGLIRRMKHLDFSEVTYDQVILVHTKEHWEKVQGTEGGLFEFLDFRLGFQDGS